MRYTKSSSAMEARVLIACAGAMFAAAVAVLFSPSVMAQQPPATSSPDYAGALGESMVVRDEVTGKLRGLTPTEVEQAVRTNNPQRTSRQREASRAVNDAIASMPATVEEAFRNPRRSQRGTLIVDRSRQEITPLFGVIGPDGVMRFSHNPSGPEDRTR